MSLKHRHCLKEPSDAVFQLTPTLAILELLHPIASPWNVIPKLGGNRARPGQIVCRFYDSLVAGFTYQLTITQSQFP